MRKYINTPGILLLFILIGAAAVRLYGLASESLWIDEALSVQTAKNILTWLTDVNLYLDKCMERNPPFYFIFLHYWMLLFGSSEFSIRLPSVIFGILSVYTIYNVTALLYDRRSALTASFIAAFTISFVYYSQEARPYGLLILMSVLSYLFFVKAYAENNYFYRVLWVITNILLLYTHVFGIFIIFAQNTFFFTRLVRKERGNVIKTPQWAVMQLIVLLSFLPWIFILKEQASYLHIGGWHSRPTLSTLSFLLWMFTGFRPLTLLLIILPFISLFSNKSNYEINKEKIKSGNKENDEKTSKRTFGNGDSLFLLMSWLLLVIFMPFVYSLFFQPIFKSRYALCAAPALFIAASGGIWTLKKKLPAVLLLAVVFIIFIFNYNIYLKTQDKDPWREVVSWLELAAQPHDVVVITSGFCKDTIYDYYAKRTDLDVIPFPPELSEMRAVEITKDPVITKKHCKELLNITNSRKRVWLLMAHHGDPRFTLVRYLEGSGYKIQFHRKYSSRIELFLAER